MHGLLATILRSAVEDGWLARSPCRRTALRDVDPADELLVLGPRGGPVWLRTFHARIWRQATLAAGLPGAAFHDLRHFYASALVAAGESVTTVRAALGHASAVETFDIYAGLWPHRDPALRTAIDKLLR